MCRRFNPGPDHLLMARGFLGNSGEIAGFFVVGYRTEVFQFELQ